MVSKKLIREKGFNTLEEYFEESIRRGFTKDGGEMYVNLLYSASKKQLEQLRDYLYTIGIHFMTSEQEIKDIFYNRFNIISSV